MGHVLDVQMGLEQVKQAFGAAEAEIEVRPDQQAQDDGAARDPGPAGVVGPVVDAAGIHEVSETVHHAHHLAGLPRVVCAPVEAVVGGFKRVLFFCCHSGIHPSSMALERASQGCPVLSTAVVCIASAGLVAHFMCEPRPKAEFQGSNPTV